MDEDLIKTLRMIIDRYQGRTQGSVFIPMADFPWYGKAAGVLDKLREQGLIVKCYRYDNGADITLTEKGRHFFDEEKEKGFKLTKEKIVQILKTLNEEMKIPDDNFGFESPGQCRAAIKQLQDQGYVAGAIFSEGGWDPYPSFMTLRNSSVTVEGVKLIEEFMKADVDLKQEFISACVKIADNPVSYRDFDEDGLNREIRGFIDSAISRFGYSICDQTQQGTGKNEQKPGELDIRINKNGIPIAIYEGMIHGNGDLKDHLEKAIHRYNRSGCKTVFVVDFSRNKGFGGFWDSVSETIQTHPGICATEYNTQLLGVKMQQGSFDWEGNKGDFYFIGVNCFTPSNNQS